MVTKLMAAEIALAAGCTTHITSGSCENPISNAIEGRRTHTVIESNITPESARHLWIATSLDIQGALSITTEALAALKTGSSLFPEDLEKAEGEFTRGDIVSIISNGEEIARGLVSFNHHEVAALIERRSPDIFSVLGYITRPDIVHNNDIAIL